MEHCQDFHLLPPASVVEVTDLAPSICLCVCGFVTATLCTTSWVHHGFVRNISVRENHLWRDCTVQIAEGASMLGHFHLLWVCHSEMLWCKSWQIMIFVKLWRIFPSAIVICHRYFYIWLTFLRNKGSYFFMMYHDMHWNANNNSERCSWVRRAYVGKAWKAGL